MTCTTATREGSIFMKYKVYELNKETSHVGSDLTHGHFFKLKDAQEYCKYHKRIKDDSTFMIAYEKDGKTHRQYYGATIY